MGLKVSVIIPVYNGEQFIARAIESVFNQSYPVFEVIVINDGSRDRTLEVLKVYEGRIILKSIENGGVSNARNQGLKIAQGDLVAFLDADDVWLKDKLEKQVVFFQRFPDVGFCCSNYYILDLKLKIDMEHFRVLKDYKVTYDEPLATCEVLRLLSAQNFVGTASTVVLRKSVIDMVGLFNTAYKQAEDFELWLRCVMVSKSVIIREVLVDKKRHGSNLTNDQFEMFSFHRMVLEDFLKANIGFIRDNNLYRDFNQALFEVNFRLGNLGYNLGRKKESVRSYLGCFRYCKSIKSFIRLVIEIFKKMIRFLSFGLISRHRKQDLIA